MPYILFNVAEISLKCSKNFVTIADALGLNICSESLEDVTSDCRKAIRRLLSSSGKTLVNDKYRCLVQLEQDDVRVPVVAWQERAWVLATLEPGTHVKFWSVVVKNGPPTGFHLSVEASSTIMVLPAPIATSLPSAVSEEETLVVPPPANHLERLFALEDPMTLCLTRSELTSLR